MPERDYLMLRAARLASSVGPSTGGGEVAPGAAHCGRVDVDGVQLGPESSN